MRSDRHVLYLQRVLMSKTLPFIALSVLAGSAIGFQAAKFGPVNPDPNGPRPIEAADTVFIEDMTWMEVRDAMRAGKDTVIVATGGIEQNGPYLVAGKHNVVLRATKIGRASCRERVCLAV